MDLGLKNRVAIVAAASRVVDARDAAAKGPGLAMVDSGNGITNLHVPSDVIIDASMPAMIRASGKMYDAAGMRLGIPNDLEEAESHG